ncbi:hypothetical protein DFH09DRAFT_1181344 [Mycena vulgaris]|nr:hypothetical protein DFH09DRAFT_1181344 [Mycena vulgaris]
MNSDSKPASVFRDTVRHLLIQAGQLAHADVAQVLDACPGIVDLAMVSTMSNPAMLPSLAKMRLRRLSSSLEKLFGGPGAIDPTHALFASLTHLRLSRLGDQQRTEQVCAHLPRLPALTHLCLHFHNDVNWNTLQMLLAECLRLEILANVCFFARADRARALTQNPPVHGQYNNRWADWEDGARGFPDLWSLAEDFVARKRSGAIEANCYWLGSLTTA